MNNGQEKCRMSRVSEEDAIVIVGAGHSGGRTAEALRGLDAQRPITIIGEEGFPPYERPALSKGILLGREDAESTYVRPLDWYERNGIALHLGVRVERCDLDQSRLFLSDGRVLPYGDLVLATGARPRRLPAMYDAPEVVTLRTLADAHRLATRLRPGVRIGIIGAGFIGLEIAAVARQLSCEVHVVERACQPLARVADAVIGRAVASLHRARGVSLSLGTGLQGIRRDGDALAMILDDGREIVADILIAGIGAEPNTELASSAGLVVEDGIVTDWRGRTSHDRVWATGDCARHYNPVLRGTRRLESWQNAQDQAISVAHAIVGLDHARSVIPWVWSDQFDFNIQSAGFPERATSVVIRGDPDGTAFSVIGIEDGRVVSATCLNAARDMRALRKMMESGKAIEPAALSDPARKLG
ncbi:FAD-dependent oxidoreductase [uncultured Methylobacterium sp.]|uniref:NAD(P)/FAD-dependent oxidoreductase n=1 Tax=uncultured Methylobacterium sp. TaxID=157278 RepID=UPI0025926F76|nr:FAD-dependent oxidoreductase [uncultured Methylobacterium sp.]